METKKHGRGFDTPERSHTDGVQERRPGEAPIMKPYDVAKVQSRVRVNKAYKMFVGGAFVHSESGRYFQVKNAADHDDADPETVNMPRGSRKDVRDAVLAAKDAQAGWEKRSAYDRGLILYRLAEVM